ncbi:MAG TPA: penicillin-binding protein 2 [Syntrophomonadaceae bacterium]|nr:penicillin-binding protein 2 [Syntrophomonadaceae bacterium]
MYYRRESRFIFLFFCFLLVFLFLEGKLAYLQLAKGEELALKAVEQRLISYKIGNFFRGDIEDLKGRSLLDYQTVYRMVVFPSLLSDPVECCQQLMSMLSEDDALKLAADFEANLKKGNPFVPDITLTESEAQKILSQQIAGIYSFSYEQRHGSDLAKHIVGYTSGSIFQQKPEEGKSGIEKFYNEELSPAEPALELAVVVDRRGKPIPGRELLLRGDKGIAARGNDVVLTLDLDVQQVVEKVLDEKAVKGAAVVIDIPTGEVRAIASRPSYSYSKAGLSGEEIDRSTELYHPGSIFKIVVAAAALAEGVVTPDETFTCEGKYRFASGEAISCWKKDGHGEISFREAFANSCNQVFVELALGLGRERLEDYAEQLGLTKSVIGYEGPTSPGGKIKIGKYDGQLGNAALGQEGVQISPVNLAALAATVARGGEYLQPSLVKKICDTRGETVREITRPAPTRVLPESVCRELQKMMELTVKEGTGKKADIPFLGSAGKTGSAETGAKDAKGQPVNNAWFVGYAPLDKPQLAVAVFVEEGGSGGESAAVLFKDIIAALQQTKIQPLSSEE